MCTQCRHIKESHPCTHISTHISQQLQRLQGWAQPGLCLQHPWLSLFEGWFWWMLAPNQMRKDWLIDWLMCYRSPPLWADLCLESSQAKGPGGTWMTDHEVARFQGSERRSCRSIPSHPISQHGERADKKALSWYQSGECWNVLGNGCSGCQTVTKRAAAVQGRALSRVFW